MLHSTNLHLFPICNQHYNPNTKITRYRNNRYESSSLFYPKNLIQKKNLFSALTTQNYQFKKATPSITNFLLTNLDKPLFNTSSQVNNENIHYSFNQNEPTKISRGVQRYHSSGNINTSNIFNKEIGNNGNKITYSETDSNVIMHCNTNYLPENKYNIYNAFPQQTLKRYEENKNNYYNNHNTKEIFSNQNNSNNFNVNNIIFDSSSINNSINSGLSLNNYNQTYVEEVPHRNFKLSDFIILNKIGEGADGSIFTVKWKKNYKIYVLKKCEVIFDEDAKSKVEVNNLLTEFLETTGTNGVIKTYGNLLTKNKFGTHYFFELMELGNETWDKVIAKRGKNKLYYQEYELMNIFSHLIKTFSSLQYRHFTHRDINPHNIMIVNGTLKICDFGNSKILEKDGFIIQKVRGSELFMSPILFKGYHSGVQTIRHNTYKSDVFSLGMCFFLAASLTYNGLNTIREIYNMNIIKKVLHKYLGKRYSLNLIELLFSMLQIDENKRPDFNQLEFMIP